jgi:hypothetical protein
MRRVPIAAALLAALFITGCGGGSARQDEDEPSGSYRLEVTRAQFPESQQLAQSSTFLVEVRNADSKTVPNVAVTVKTDPGVQGEAPVAFGQRKDDPDLADPARPVWIIDEGPQGGDTAYTNTWQLGALKPGATARFEWKLTAVQAGDFTVNYEVAPGLDGKATLAENSPKASGSFDVTITDEPAQTRVDENGNVVRVDDANEN